MRMARCGDPGLVVQADGVHDERSTIPTANRIPHPSRIEIGGMSSSIGPDLAQRVTRFEQHKHTAGGLKNFERTNVVHQPRNTKRSTTRYIRVHGIVDCTPQRALPTPDRITSLR